MLTLVFAVFGSVSLDVGSIDVIGSVSQFLCAADAAVVVMFTAAVVVGFP